MMILCYKIVFFILLFHFSLVKNRDEVQESSNHSGLMLVLLVPNRPLLLPYALTCIAHQDYPKNKIFLQIIKTGKEKMKKVDRILQIWLINHKEQYGRVEIKVLERSLLSELKESALNEARRLPGIRFIWFLSANAFITNKATLRQFVTNGFILSAPVLNSVTSYSTFWTQMSDDFRLSQNQDPNLLVLRKNKGCFPVPVIQVSYFISVKDPKAQDLTFLPHLIEDYNGPPDDKIVLAFSAKKAGIQPHVCNLEVYGYVTVPLVASASRADAIENLVELELKMISHHGPLEVEKELESFVIPTEKNLDTLGVDQVYVINLKRRDDRRRKMEACMNRLGVKYKLVDAVDGQKLDQDYLNERKLKVLPGFKDPYKKRPVTFGEIGCLLSHHNVWLDVMKNGYQAVIVLEDDVNFLPSFRKKLSNLLEETKNLSLDWDLIYLGRKGLQMRNESPVPGSRLLVNVGYSYWTIGYLLSAKGAKLLVDEEPLKKILPVDEYLPIMYDQHPSEVYKKSFQNRSLKAFSANPLLITPSHYTHEEKFISDTEKTRSVQEERKEEL